MGTLEQFTPLQPQDKVVVTPIESTPRNLLPSLEIAHKVDEPVVIVFVEVETFTPNNVGTEKEVDGEGMVEVRDKAK